METRSNLGKSAGSSTDFVVMNNLGGISNFFFSAVSISTMNSGFGSWAWIISILSQPDSNGPRPNANLPCTTPVRTRCQKNPKLSFLNALNLLPLTKLYASARKVPPLEVSSSITNAQVWTISTPATCQISLFFSVNIRSSIKTKSLVILFFGV